MTNFTILEIKTDKDRLLQALINLLSNAYKNTRKGEIALSIASKARRCGQKFLAITVSDTGRGISQKDSEIVFAPHKRIIDPIDNTKGHGLGLVVTRTIVKQFGGNLDFRQNPCGQGTEFFFEFDYEVHNESV